MVGWQLSIIGCETMWTGMQIRYEAMSMWLVRGVFSNVCWHIDSGMKP